MEHISQIIILAISGFYIYSIIRHMLRPGNNTGYTRMLMFACLATLPLVFLMGMIAGRAELIFEFDLPGEWSDFGFQEWYLLIGMFLLLLLPFALLTGLCFMLELRGGLMFILFLIPALSRLALITPEGAILSGVSQVFLFLASIVIGALIVMALERYASGSATYEKHVQKILPGYGTAANMFFGVCVFALANQVIEFCFALFNLLR